MNKRMHAAPVLLGTAVVVVILAIIGGLFLLGSPAHQRTLRLDQQRINDLIRLSTAIDAYAAQHDTLPASLTALDFGAADKRFTTDPVSGHAYDYAMTGTHRYELCADFSNSAPAQELPLSTLTSASAIRWQGHPAGHACFTFTDKHAANQRKP